MELLVNPLEEVMHSPRGDHTHLDRWITQLHSTVKYSCMYDVTNFSAHLIFCSSYFRSTQLQPIHDNLHHAKTSCYTIIT